MLLHEWFYLHPTTSGLWAVVYITLSANNRQFGAFPRCLPPPAIHWNLPRPLREIGVWVKTWVKNVVLLWVSQTDSFHRQIWTYDTFKTTLDSLFLGSRWPGFQEVFHPLFSSLTSIPGGFLPLPVISHSRFQHGSKTWVRLIFFPRQNLHPIPRCGDCTIAFRNCKSFLSKSNCLQVVPSDTTQR